MRDNGALICGREISRKGIEGPFPRSCWRLGAGQRLGSLQETNGMRAEHARHLPTHPQVRWVGVVHRADALTRTPGRRQRCVTWA